MRIRSDRLLLIFAIGSAECFQPHSLVVPRSGRTSSLVIKPIRNSSPRHVSFLAATTHSTSSSTDLYTELGDGTIIVNGNGQHHDNENVRSNVDNSTESNVVEILATTPSLDVERDEHADYEVRTSIPSSGIQLAMAEMIEEAEPDNLQFRSASYEFIIAALVGIITGFSVAIFKLSIEFVRQTAYSMPSLVDYPGSMALIPAAGGLMVGLILLLGALPPGLRGTVGQVDEESRGPIRTNAKRIQYLTDSVRKSAAAVFTLGTGNSLGPEGPCVEIGMGTARACMDVSKNRKADRRRIWHRTLLSCGAAAGVAAGFDAPVAGVFFALEVMQSAFTDMGEEQTNRGDKNVLWSEGLFSSTSRITPVLLSSVLSALCARSLLGQHLIFHLSHYSLPEPLIELPMYLLLGSICGCVAFIFSQAAKLSQSFFNGEVGNEQVRLAMKDLPAGFKPVLGGLFCGTVGLFFPQILFFGYETLNPLLANNSMPTTVLLTILVVKAIATAVAAGSGLVGGTFAPSLFLGALVGASFHNIIASMYDVVGTSFDAMGIAAPALVQLADLPAYAMVGSASVLAALFRAPLTASLLLFELSRDYDVILPLIASAGVGSVLADILDEKVEQAKNLRRDKDPASWGDLSR